MNIGTAGCKHMHVTSNEYNFPFKLPNVSVAVDFVS